MEQKELQQTGVQAGKAFSDARERAGTFLDDVQKYRQEKAEFCNFFLNQGIQEKGSRYQEKLREAEILWQEVFDEVAGKAVLEADYRKLMEDKRFLKEADMPLISLMGALCPEKGKMLQDALYTDETGKKRRPEEVSEEYQRLRNKLRKEVADAGAFDTAVNVRKKNRGVSGTTNEGKFKAGEFRVGGTVTFGQYPQTEKGRDQTPIEWQVLDIKEGKALLISKYGLDAKPYNTNYMNVTWETCTLRTWLNKDFLRQVFSAEEQGRLQEMLVTADQNPDYSTAPGNATKDRIFLLSIPEVKKYFKTDKARQCAPTKYAKAQGAFTSNNYKTADGAAACWWWLRSPGDRSNRAADVNYDGSVRCFGNLVHYDDVCVRPALWINLES